jgi:ligand-binding sensor protein/AraC-like DNA-binding protein
MNRAYVILDKILDLAKWQSLQDGLSQVTRLAILTIDYKGVPITAHSSCNLFCQYIRKDPLLKQYCYRCDSRGGLEAVRTAAPYIYRCHCDILDIAIPITVDGKYVGAVMAGQVRLPVNEESVTLERILNSPVTDRPKTGALQDMYDVIPVIPYRRIRIMANMLFDLANYIVSEALEKNLILEMYDHLQESRDFNSNTVKARTLAAGYPIESIERLRKDLDHIVTDAHIASSDILSEGGVCKNPILRPAFEYIYENKSEVLSQKKMAALCHVSASHFSRLFLRETGESFSGFVARQKVAWSKNLLEQSNISIAQISDLCGFSDPGYYIKIFKKHERITPAAYRKFCRSHNVSAKTNNDKTSASPPQTT